MKTEREGFEPSVQFPVHRISSAVPSATRTPLQTALLPTKLPIVYRTSPFIVASESVVGMALVRNIKTAGPRKYVFDLWTRNHVDGLSLHKPTGQHYSIGKIGQRTWRGADRF